MARGRWCAPRDPKCSISNCVSGNRLVVYYFALIVEPRLILSLRPLTHFTSGLTVHLIGKGRSLLHRRKMASYSLHPFFKTTPSAQLGPLERQVLQAVWARGTATVREVLEDRTIWQTYPTIMTTMDRLFKKGLLARVPDGRAFRYSARYTPQELERTATENGIRQLLDSEYALLHLSYLVEAVSAQDGKLLDELQSLVEHQRAQLKKGEQE